MARMRSLLPGITLLLCTSCSCVGAQLACSITSLCPSMIVNLTCEEQERRCSLVFEAGAVTSSNDQLRDVLTACTNSTVVSIVCTLSDDVQLSRISFESEQELELLCKKNKRLPVASCATNATKAVDCQENVVPLQTSPTPSLQPVPVLLIALSATGAFVVVVCLLVLVAILLLVLRCLYKKHQKLKEEHKNETRNTKTNMEDAKQASATGPSTKATALSNKRLLFSFSAPQLHITPREVQQSLKSYQQNQAAGEYMVPKDVVILPKDDISKKNSLEPIYAEPIPLPSMMRRSSEPISHHRNTRAFEGELLADMPGYSTPPEVHIRDSTTQKDSGRMISLQGDMALHRSIQEGHDGPTYDTIL